MIREKFIHLPPSTYCLILRQGQFVLIVYNVISDTFQNPSLTAFRKVSIKKLYYNLRRSPPIPTCLLYSTVLLYQCKLRRNDSDRQKTGRKRNFAERTRLWPPLPNPLTRNCLREKGKLTRSASPSAKSATAMASSVSGH